MIWPRAIIHIDMDTFFVSVERKHDPSLVGKPVIVGGGKDGDTRRGVVAACSYETRAFGVHSAMPLAQALRLCPKAILVPVGRSNYAVETEKVRGVLDNFTDLHEMTSPDEAYVDLQGTERLHGHPIAAAEKLRWAIIERVGLPVSVGLATTSTHAKIASKLSKPRGMFVVLPGGEAAIVRPMKLRALPGLGPKTAKRLESYGMTTLGQLIDAGDELLHQLLGDWGVDLRHRAMGEGSGRIEPDRERQQISNEATFAEDLADENKLHAHLSRITMKIGAHLRKSEQYAGTLTLKLRYPDFTTLTRQMPLAPPTNDDGVLFRVAKELLKKTWDRRQSIRLIGVGASNLGESVQDDLFEQPKNEKREKLLRAMDAVRTKRGKDKIIWGTALGDREIDDWRGNEMQRPEKSGGN